MSENSRKVGPSGTVGLSGEEQAAWERLLPHVRQEIAQTTDDLQLARLRGSVRQGVAELKDLAERRADGYQTRRRSLIRALASVAASLVIGASSVLLVPVPGGGAAENTPVEQEGAVFSMDRTVDGSVVFRFQDGREIHKISKSSDPAMRSGARKLTARGEEFVDRNGTPAPGSVTFYRID